MNIKCPSYGTVTFTKEGIELMSKHSIRPNVLYLHKVKIENTGTYYCQGNLDKSSRFNVSSQLFVAGQ